MGDDDLHINALGEVQIGDRLLNEREIDEGLDEDEQEVVTQWREFHKELSTNVFRFYGHRTGLHSRDKDVVPTSRVDLETEFEFWTNDGDTKAKIWEFARAMGADIHLMSESEEDGHPTTQVDMCLNVFGQKVEDVRTVVERWRVEIIERGLDQYWVSVL